METGYSGTPLPKKLGLKPGFKVLLINDPKHYLDLLEPFPEGVKFVRTTKGEVDFIHLFVESFKELEKHLPKAKSFMKKDGMMWISWPKKTSGIKCDVDGNIVRSEGLKTGLVDIKVCAVDESWSGLKFVYRTKDR